MKLPAWIDESAIGSTSLTAKLSASTSRITSPLRSFTTRVLPSKDSTLPRRRCGLGSARRRLRQRRGAGQSQGGEQQLLHDRHSVWAGPSGH